LSRKHYTCRSNRAARRWVTAVLAPILLAGCSLQSLSARNVPATTGSIDAGVGVEVARPLPETLAYSDAARIGQAASAALWQAEGRAPGEWVNARTGSSGTLSVEAESRRDCRPFSTTVTSLGGVHQYSGTICRAGDARSVLKIAESGTEEGS
jgi:surface antigen